MGRKILFVCGPTASGKTDLGVQLARRFNGEIVSADSRQVYRGMDIGTGKDRESYRRDGQEIPLHLIDMAEPGETYSLYNYLNDFAVVLNEISRRMRLPIVVGGTGLYIEAIIKGYNIPAVPENAALRVELMKEDKESLVQRLEDLDKELSRRTDLSSKKRIVRALEIALATPNVSPAGSIRDRIGPVEPLVLCTAWERDELHRRIDRRLDERLRAGMVDEVKRLLENGVPERRLIMFGMEYRHCTRYIRGEIDYPSMVEELRKDIYHLAKRQETWFRGMERRGITVHRIPQAAIEEAERVV